MRRASAVETPPGARANALRRVARGSAANLTGAVISATSTFALTVAVTRGLTKSDAGVFFSVTSIFLVATSVGQLGTDTGLVYFLSRCRALGTPELIRSYMRAAMRPVLLIAVAMSACVFVLAPQLAASSNPDHQGLATAYLRVLALFIPFAGLESVALAATRGLGTMRPNAVVEQLTRPLVQLGLVVAALAFAPTIFLSWGWAAAYVLAAALAWSWWNRLCSRADLTHDSTDVRVGGQFWRFTAPRSLASVAQLLLQRLDIVLVGALSSAANAAIYAAATRFIVLGQMSRGAISFAVQPPLAEALARDDHSESKRLFQTSTAWLMGVAWPLYLTFAVMSEPLLGVFGRGYDSGSTVLLLISLSMLIATGCGDVDSVLIMAGKTSWSLANMLLALVINVGLDLWLIPEHGVLGAAIGWAVAIVAKNVSALIQVWIALGLHPFGEATLTMTALALASFALIPGALRLTFGADIVTLIVGVLLGGAVFIGGGWLLAKPLELYALWSRSAPAKSPTAQDPR